MTDDTPGRSTPTPDEALHNPWDASCSRNGFGEPSREGEQCLVCFPARPPVGDTTAEPIRYIDGLPVTEENRGDFLRRATGAHARGDWEQERRALDAIHLLDIAERDRLLATQPQPTDEPVYSLFGDYLAVCVNQCTCYGGQFGHERGCGYEPIAKVAEIEAALGAVAQIRALCDEIEKRKNEHAISAPHDKFNAGAEHAYRASWLSLRQILNRAGCL